MTQSTRTTPVIQRELLDCPETPLYKVEREKLGEQSYGAIAVKITLFLFGAGGVAVAAYGLSYALSPHTLLDGKPLTMAEKYTIVAFAGFSGVMGLTAEIYLVADLVKRRKDNKKLWDQFDETVVDPAKLGEDVRAKVLAWATKQNFMLPAGWTNAPLPGPSGPAGPGAPSGPGAPDPAKDKKKLSDVQIPLQDKEKRFKEKLKTAPLTLVFTDHELLALLATDHKPKRVGTNWREGKLENLFNPKKAGQDCLTKWEAVCVEFGDASRILKHLGPNNYSRIMRGITPGRFENLYKAMQASRSLRDEMLKKK